ncbi:unnamed protein product [Symbiodinium pilosum]|uniref:Uncharacterized protein n=1 Tax=Symbiodinium pilosum TaxID=2952 RepID=A0A812X203_SYMPI|nr:unnamed protein product [Symbiodinium pilosum]
MKVMRNWSLSFLAGRRLCIVLAFSALGQWLFTSLSPRHPGRVLHRAAARRAEGKPPDVYQSFLMKARSEGAKEALRYASSTMPKAFCLNFSDLKLAAEFAAQERHEAAEERRPWRLRVCTKCIKKQGFDTLDGLQNLRLAHGTDTAEGEVIVEPSGCFKQCKRGPNVRVVSQDDVQGLGAVIAGMTPEEVGARCFHHVNDNAAAQRVFKATRAAMKLAEGETLSSLGDTQDGSRQGSQQGPVRFTLDSGNAAKDKDKRNRVRKSIETRVANILEGLPARLSGEDLI